MKFADTSWWVAWSLPSDRNHRVAVDLHAVIGRNEQVLTTNHVVGETWTFLHRRGGHAAAVRFFDVVDELVALGRLVVHQVTVEQEVAARGWLRARPEREYSFVDATSFRVMRDRRLREALAFDNDFSAAGFLELRT